MIHWLAAVLGLTNASGPAYLWWSGICGDLAFVGAAYSIVRRHNCHTPRCLRVGRIPVAGTPYVVCARHHPDEQPGYTPDNPPQT